MSLMPGGIQSDAKNKQKDINYRITLINILLPLYPIVGFCHMNCDFTLVCTDPVY
jgi:hypothetical protein